MSNNVYIGHVYSVSKSGKVTLKTDTETVEFVVPQGHMHLVTTLAHCFIGNTKVVITLSSNWYLESIAEYRDLNFSND